MSRQKTPSPLSQYYREWFPADLRAALADASNGEFSRYWQLDLERSYQYARQDGLLTPQCQQLWDTLQRVLARVPQWSNEEAESASARQSGGTLLFYTEDPRFRTMAEIVRTAPRAYSVAAIIDSETPEHERPAVALRMKQSLERWLIEHELRPDALPLPGPDALDRQTHYSTLGQAAACLLAALSEPAALEG